MNFEYLAQPPKRYTFEQPKLKRYVQGWFDYGNMVLNLFAGKVRLDIDSPCTIREYRVDLSDEFSPDYVGDAYEFVLSAIEKGVKFDVIVLDPPYNLRKSREKYDGRYIGSFTKIKNLLPKILEPHGIIITLGYDTVGMSKSRGFKKVGIGVVCHGGDHNDTLVVVEEKEGG